MRPAKAPSGTVAELRVACAQTARAPERWAAACASRARRDLPTPAPALTTTPRQSSSPIASAIRVSSASRPTSGHVAAREDVAAGDPPSMAHPDSRGRAVQRQAMSFAFSASYSAWVRAPLSRSPLAFSSSLAAPPPSFATDCTYSLNCDCAACARSALRWPMP